MKIVVLGAGAWGTALAINVSAASSNHQVTLWARDAQQVATMQLERENKRYLPGISFPAGLLLSNSALESITADADLLILAAPMSGLRNLLAALKNSQLPVVWLCKGFEASTSSAFGLMAHEIQAQMAPHLCAGVLSGPSFAQEVAQHRPTALVAASVFPQVREALVTAFHASSLRIYTHDDVVGVEVGGAVKNVLAIATGLCDGLQLGLNARAALITRGLAEMTRLGLALGARTETFMGLSGLGDLVLTATGDLSRNRKVGLLLAQGYSLPQAVASLGHVSEGVYCARTVVERARSLQVDMPIAQAVVALLDGQLKPSEAVALLMGRAATYEA